MSRRTFESPMEWEYENAGPVDASSPLAQISQQPRLATFNSSPSRFGQQARNPFAGPSPIRPMPNNQSHGNQSKPLPPPPPHSHFFNPQLQPQVQHKFSAPAFRNPAFTTPQKRIDELAFSEMSGAESSPAMTEDSEMPDETPEVDRTEDLRQMTITQATANRKLFGGTGKPRSRTPGKGELSRGSRDIQQLRGKIRKRTRQTGDRDVGSVRSRLKHESDESDSDWEQQDANDKSRRQKKKINSSKAGVISGFLTTISTNPDAPMILSSWLKTLVNFVLIGGFLWILYSCVAAARSDLANAAEQERAKILGEMQSCAHEYTKNRCSPMADRAPALNRVCDEWEGCMNQDPTSVMRVQISARNMAQILNEFTSVLSYKAWGFILSVLLVGLLVNNIGSLSRPMHHHQPQQPFPSQQARPPMLTSPMHHHDPNQAFIWAPISQTPRHIRKGLFAAANDEATDTDNSPDQVKAIMGPPQTPSGRRSPSKFERDRGRSPTKSGRV